MPKLAGYFFTEWPMSARKPHPASPGRIQLPNSNQKNIEKGFSASSACSAVLKHFDQVAEAPDAIPRLRRFILDLAVRGKLVEQDPKDEPAAILLERVHAWREDGIRRKLIRSPRKPLKRVVSSEAPYSLPKGWEWMRLGEVIYIQSGDGLTSENMNDGDIPVYGGNGVNGYHDEFNITEPTVVIGRVGYYCGSIHITPEKAWVTDNAFITIFSSKIIFLDFLVILLKGTNLKENENATAQPVISGSKIYPIVIGVPPIAEQKRIVGKVDELMALCDELEKAQAKRESRRDRLVAATLAGLTTEQTEQAEKDSASSAYSAVPFFLKHMPRITTRPEHIQQLRQTILNFAFRGKLIPQRPVEETGEELLKRLNAAHPKDRKFGSSRKKDQQSIDLLNCPGIFVIPYNWQWAYLDFICEQIADIDHSMPRTTDHGVPFISAKDLKDDGTIDFRSPKMISEEDYQRLSRKIKIQCGDIIYSRIGARLGKARLVKVDTRFLISYSCCLVRPMHKFVDKQYVQRFLDSKLALSQAHRGVQSIGVPDLGLGEIKGFNIPIPPLAEQHRIVAKVDELTALCDKLETQLTSTSTTRRQLLEATLQEALAS
jgi:type I restriction enzyme, S subunit